MRQLFGALLAFVLGASAFSQMGTKEDQSSCPMHEQHAAANAHHAAVQTRGDEGMGFSHTSTTHHFRTRPNGGEIEVTIKDPDHRENLEAIRSHLAHIAVMFSRGDFSTPMLIHGVVPPGVTTMKLLKATIRYRYEDLLAGGMVRIETQDPVAVAAIHDFLRFQISEHQTGDSPRE